MAVILNIDTTTKNCSVAIASDGQPLAHVEAREGFNHAELLTGFIQQALAKADLHISDLDAVAISEGPGSYTGLRIGTSVAKGICYGHNLPLIAIGSMKALAHQVKQQDQEVENIITIMDSRKDELYIAAYSHNLTEQIPPKPINVKSINTINIPDGKSVVAGTGYEKIKSTKFSTIVQYNNHLYYSALNMQMLSFIKYQNKAYKNLIYFEPLYLKSVYVTQSKSLPINR